MSVRGAVGVVAVLVVATVAVPSSIVTPNTSREAVTGVRSVSSTENDAAAQHWTTQTQAAATPVPTSSPVPTTTAAPATQAAQAPATTDAPAPPTPDANSTEPLGPGVPTVGALFTADANGLTGHYCTASVVDSPAGDLVITAAHCIHDGAGGNYRTDIAFVPGYHDGQDPYGIWTPTRLVVDPRWISDSDQDLDFGFLVVHKQGSQDTVQSLAGGNQLGTNRGYDQNVKVTGYPDDSEKPVTCQTTTREQQQYQMRFDCGEFPDGTSGGPWVANVDPTSGLGIVVGVIGGYETGGDTPEVSYSSYFDDDIQQLYDTAITPS